MFARWSTVQEMECLEPIKRFVSGCSGFAVVIWAVYIFSWPVVAAASPQSIRVVMDNHYPPFAMRGADGELQGILVDQWRLWERKTGIKVEIQGMDWGQAQKRMRAGEFNVLDTVFKTQERMEYLLFSKPYQKIEVPIFFDKEIAGIIDAKSLQGFPVGVKTGDADIDLLRANGVDTLLQFESYEEVLQAARDHKVTVFVVDLPPALYYLHKFSLQDEFRHSAPLMRGEFHRAVARGNTALLQTVEDGFARISAAEYKDIEDKWYGVENFGQRSLRWLLPVAASCIGAVLFLFAWNRTLQRTVRRRTVELKASQALFQSIYHSVNDAIFIHDLETGVVVDVNERMCAMYRCTREEALGMAVKQFSSDIAPYGQAEALGWLRKAATGEPQTFTWHCGRRDGTLFWGEVSMCRAHIGSIDRIVVTVRDRTAKQEEENALRERLASQQRLEAIAEATPGVLYVFRRGTDGSASFLFASPRIEEIYGVSREELLRDGLAILKIVHPDDVARMQDSIAASARSLQEWTLSYRMIHPKRGVIWVEGHATLRREPDGSTLWHGFTFEITDRVNAEMKLKKANAVLQIRAACDQALVRADDEQTLLRSVCATAVEAGGYRMAWIGLAENDEGRSVRPVAMAGLEAGYLVTTRVSWADNEYGRGPAGTAVRTGETVVAQNLATNPAFALWRTEAMKRGYAAMLAIPIFCDGTIFGALMIYSARPEDFAPDEVSVFAELVANLGVRLEAIRAKELRLRAETELRKSQDQLTATLNALPDLLFEVDRGGRIYDFRAPHTRSLFIPPDSFLGRTFAEVMPADVVSVLKAGLDEAADHGRHFGGTYSLPMPDGLKWYELSIALKKEARVDGQRFIVLVRDVTKRKLAEEALRESERYSRTLFDQTPIGLMLCRMDGSIVDVNPACARIIGRTVEESLTLTYWELTPHRFAERETQQLDSLRTIGRYGPYEKQYIHKDGHLVPVRLNGLIIHQRGEDFIWSSIEDITERLQAEAASRLSADRLQQAVLVSQIGIFDHDHVANSMYCSPVLRSIYGLGADQPVNIADYLERVHPDDREWIARAVQCSLEPTGGGLFDVELRIIRPDGVVRRVTTRAQTQFTGTGVECRPMRTVGAVVDITDRKLAEDALAARTNQVQHVLGAANCLLWQSIVTRRAAGGFDWQLYIPHSSLYQRLFGKDPGNPPVLHWEELAVPELDAMHATCLQALTSGASSYEQEFHAVVDGRTVWLREQVSVNRDVGSAWILVGVITDITERKAAEALLRENEGRLAGIIDSAMDAIVTTDESGQIVVFNHAAEGTFCCSASAAIGQSVERFIPQSMRAIHAEYLRRESENQEQGKVFRLVSGFGLRANGEEFPCEASVSHIVVKGQRLFTVILRDVSARVRAEAERKTLQAQVLRSQRLESVGRLAGGIAHDLNNILAPIVLGAPMLREVMQNQDDRDTLNAMEVSANRGAKIIAQLLTFSRGGGGERVPIQLALIVREMVAIIRETFPKNITANTEVPREVWPVRGDATQLHQVLMNLCVNARDAMPAGGILTLGLEGLVLDQAAAGKMAGLQPGPYVLLSVTDTGTGIAPEVIDKIYDPFFTTKEVGKGTGLGLSTVLGIVQDHAGVVHADSCLGGGTKFSVYLPAVESGANLAPAAVDVPQLRGNDELILLVDDEAYVRLVTRRLLERNGYRVVEAANGREALASLEQNRLLIAAVVTDLIMPECDGPSFILELRKLDPALPVIATSGHVAGVDQALLNRAHIQAVLEKPFEISELLEQLDRVLHPPASHAK